MGPICRVCDQLHIAVTEGMVRPLDRAVTQRRLGTALRRLTDYGPMLVGNLKRVAPVFAVRNLRASLEHYQRLGFATREYQGGGYGFATRDGIEIHLGVVPESDANATASTAYVWVDDADELARAWRLAGADVHLPEDTDWGQHEGVLIDPDGNIIRFGSPTRPADAGNR